MRGILNIRMLSVRAALLAVLVALMLPGAQAQSAKQNEKADNKASNSNQAQTPSSNQATEKKSSPAKEGHAGVPHEGIAVHGHWVIDVSNPNGKLVTHHEFENDYVATNFLPSLMARQSSVGFWGVQLTGSGPNNYFITEAQNTCSGTNCFNTLAPPSYDNAVFTLTGTFTAPLSDTISQVQTTAFWCNSSTPPATPCPATGYFAFTRTTPSGVTFVSGQIVQVTVNITFSK